MFRHDPPLVLIVDDEMNTTIMVQRIFEREGYQVEAANDGTTALKLARQRLPDLILLDIRMPGMDGFDVLRLLRDEAETARIPTILLTANAREPSDVARGLDLGADDYLYKPFAPQELVARSQSKMKARQLEDKLQRRTQDLGALLRISEELNQHFETHDLREAILKLALDLLPGDAAALYETGDGNTLTELRLGRGSTESMQVAPLLADPAVIEQMFAGRKAVVWTRAEPLVADYPYGLAVPLQHDEHNFGVAMLYAGDDVIDDQHRALAEGFARQAGLALRNAELYEMQANWLQRLEDMVAERTAELQSAQQMLVRSEKLASIGHLAANIAHEINNPLQPITITLDDLVECVNNNEQVDIRGIEIIQDSVERIRRIVRQLLEFTGRRNTGPDVQDLDLPQILERIIDLNRKFFEKQNNTITLEAGKLPRVHGSKDQLEQVFMNLTLNAQAALEPGGELKISAETDGNEVVIKFTDNGSGIAPHDLDKIFDPFFSTKPTGTGLGLFVTYGIVQGHQGTIEVDSELGQGTTFTIRLPIQAQPTVQPGAAR